MTHLSTFWLNWSVYMFAIAEISLDAVKCNYYIYAWTAIFKICYNADTNKPYEKHRYTQHTNVGKYEAYHDSALSRYRCLNLLC